MDARSDFAGHEILLTARSEPLHVLIGTLLATALLAAAAISSALLSI